MRQYQILDLPVRALSTLAVSLGLAGCPENNSASKNIQLQANPFSKENIDY